MYSCRKKGQNLWHIVGFFRSPQVVIRSGPLLGFFVKLKFMMSKYALVRYFSIQSILFTFITYEPFEDGTFFSSQKYFSTFLFYFNSKWLHKNLMIIKKTIFLSFKQNGNLHVKHSMLDRKSASLVLQ